MKYPVAFCDYDDTIFDHQSDCVPARTLEAVSAYVQAGGRFVLTTGRMYRSIMQELARIDFKPDYLICLQGAVGYDFGVGEVFRHDMPAADWHTVARYAEQRGWVFQYYHGQDVYTQQVNPFSLAYFAYTGVQGVIVGEALSTWPAAADWSAHKMIVMSPPAETAERVAALRAAFGHLDITCSSPQYIEVCSAHSGKGNAVRAMCRHLGVDVSESVAFGDQTNDISLLQAAGLGVAVGNAVPELRQAADYVCAPCAQAGVADVLYAIIDGKPLPEGIQ